MDDRIGPYTREIVLPEPVKGALANATYGNGVLVLSIPTLAGGEPPADAEFRLTPVDSARGHASGTRGGTTNR